MRFSRTSERPGSRKIRLLSGGEIFFRNEPFSRRSCAGQRNETNIFRDGPRRSRWEDRFYSGLNPVIYSALSRQQRQQRRRWWWSCTSCCCFPLRLFLCLLHRDFYVLFTLFFSPFPSCNLSPGFRSLARRVHSRESFILEIEGRHRRHRTWLYRRVVKTAKGNRPESMENFSRRR